MPTIEGSWPKGLANPFKERRNHQALLPNGLDIMMPIRYRSTPIILADSGEPDYGCYASLL